MKKFVFGLSMLFSVALLSNELSSPEWLVFIGSDGTVELYDDGCSRSTILWENGDQWNEEGPC